MAEVHWQDSRRRVVVLSQQGSLGAHHAPKSRTLVFPRRRSTFRSTSSGEPDIVESWRPPVDFAQMPRLTGEVYKAEDAE